MIDVKTIYLGGIKQLRPAKNVSVYIERLKTILANEKMVYHLPTCYP